MSRKKASRPHILDFVIIGLCVYIFGVLILLSGNRMLERCEAWEGEPYISNCDAPYYTIVGNTLAITGAISFVALPVVVIFRGKADKKGKK